MSGERDLDKLQRHLAPTLHPEPFVYCSFPDFRLPPGLEPICTFREAEGLTAIVEQAAADRVEVPHVFKARMITLKPFERSSINLIESAIRNAQLGLNPSSDGELIRIPIPPLTEERRRDLAKTARKEGEDCKIAIRKARHDAKDMLDELEKSGDVGKDDAARALKDLEAIVKDGVTKVDDMVAKKEEDIMKV